tara:strand:- start:28959 stop:30128 length:1170 start_codon:yes stop_codon:yes gene_type:complete
MAIPKKVKKSLDIYPVVRNQENYPHGYNGSATPERRKQLAEFITKDGTYLPKSVLHADLDLGMLEFVKSEIPITLQGKEVPVIKQILTTQRWGEFTNTWEFVDGDENITLPFVCVVRRPDVQFGTNPSLQYTIPNRKTFHYAKVPTWDGQRKGMDLYKIPQPVPVDITYEVRLVCNRMRELNQFNRVVLQKFSSRQAYTFVKGHYIPIILETISDESQISDLESRKFYMQNYTFQMQGFLIDEEEFEVTPAISRSLLLFETGTKTKKKKPHSLSDENPDKVCESWDFYSGCTSNGLTGSTCTNGSTGISSTGFTITTSHSVNKTYDYNINLQLSTQDNVGTYSVYQNGTFLGVDYNQIIEISNGDVLSLVVTPTNPYNPSSIEFCGKIL